MVRGIGVDIIEIDRIRRSIESTGMGFLGKVYTDGEIAYCDAKAHRYQHYAARFAAKEALSKALSTGWAGEFRWKDVEVVNEPSGQPRFTLHGTLGARLAATDVMLSMSHSDTHVVAMVVIQEGQA
ncbi:MAG TPA: holo-ACP synthase [Bacteroidota bacterium]|nr:holo-ACP synthase [Bacteroidota bacterium]